MAICSDPANQFAFEGVERVCWPSYGLAMHRNKGEWKSKSDDSRSATLLSAQFRQGVTPDMFAGLNLPADGAGPDQL